MNPKQEKRFWSADQKRFVYSLRLCISRALLTFSFPVGTQDILDSVYATDCIDGDISNKVEITGDSVFFLNIAGEYEIWLQVTNSCGDMVTVPVTLEMVDYRQQTERTKRAEAAKQTERTNLTEKATEETGQKETEGAENGTKAG